MHHYLLGDVNVTAVSNTHAGTSLCERLVTQRNTCALDKFVARASFVWLRRRMGLLDLQANVATMRKLWRCCLIYEARSARAEEKSRLIDVVSVIGFVTSHIEK